MTKALHDYSIAEAGALRRGVFPLSYTLDHCGPLSWTVEDSAIAMEVIAGFDPRDPASWRYGLCIYVSS